MLIAKPEAGCGEVAVQMLDKARNNAKVPVHFGSHPMPVICPDGYTTAQDDDRCLLRRTIAQLHAREMERHHPTYKTKAASPATPFGALTEHQIMTHTLQVRHIERSDIAPVPVTASPRRIATFSRMLPFLIPTCHRPSRLIHSYLPEA